MPSATAAAPAPSAVSTSLRRMGAWGDSLHAVRPSAAIINKEPYLIRNPTVAFIPSVF
ncbi:hypothetical protein GCM10011324_04610 [Allosediminivita pacifica]|nr:hypothetical protein GCM10011324_04610 [Allosediminivita pacifica]